MSSAPQFERSTYSDHAAASRTETRSHDEVANASVTRHLAQAKKTPATLNFTDEEPLGPTNPVAHYEVSHANRHHLDLTAWVHEHGDDLAVHVRQCSVIGMLNN